jgi:hypothetical protein
VLFRLLRYLVFGALLYLLVRGIQAFLRSIVKSGKSRGKVPPQQNASQAKQSLDLSDVQDAEFEDLTDKK